MHFLSKAGAKAAWFFGFCAMSIAGLVPAQANPFENGWVLQPEGSSLRFQTIKNQTKVESSTFTNFGGAILPNGSAEIEIDLASVDTKVDLRNVRMRFLLFETFVFPTAKVTAQIDAEDFADLANIRRKTVQLPYRLSLRGIEQDAVAEVSITLLADDLVIVSTTTPISIAAASFDLTKGIGRLEEAANVKIIPSATVSFDFMFVRNSEAQLTAFPKFEVQEPAAVQTASAQTGATSPVQNASIAPVGEPFSAAECKVRYNVIRQLGPLVFPGSNDELTAESRQMLLDVAETINHCPGGQVEIGVHSFDTDDGTANRERSERKAVIVRDYLLTLVADPTRLVAVGYGDAYPRVPISSVRAARTNQRVEFSPLNK